MSIEAFERCNQILKHIMGDTSVPRNIRRAAEESKNLLSQDDDEPTVRASTVISILDEISNDPNIPIHARTLIWNVLSELESVRE
ncbi:MAG: uncharacterized protein PWQ15_1877 [Methanobacterium sp.]|jgi:uncharacterized protein (UPF0147 family)|uniref:UPF0147 family protein n=1 Tax=Methanobacterium sp. TaxID=2164 RepID=UPI0003C943B1|nr:UPF0147 family protein [Methanobacterium sp.]MDI3550774.1 uncharacterized protein [Methanobacterium sp.]CDG66103.1 hypothetical protein MBMB1_2029 [Methanobacterium sp. MB1]